jgi:5,10-methylene-tetrahydrofolate dehydrogenase/methenyl tetrahydrofolate cyclohydrolase
MRRCVITSLPHYLITPSPRGLISAAFAFSAVSRSSLAKEVSVQAAGKIALVTGAARRVGKSIALALAERGAHMVNTYRRSQAEAQQTQQAIEACGVHGMVVQGDITRAVEVEAMVQQVIQHV